MKQTMINNSIRFFSVDEIKKYIKENRYPNDFVEYIKVAPAYIISILDDMGMANSVLDIAQEPKAEPPKSIESLHMSDTAESVQEMIMEHPQTVLEEIVCPKATESLKAEQTIISCNKDEPNKEELSIKAESPTDADLYSNMKFGERILVNRLVLYETTDSKCEEHGLDYQTIRVVMRINKREFAVRTKCCPKCKKLYMKASNFQGIKGLLDKKKINYTWIPIKE